MGGKATKQQRDTDVGDNTYNNNSNPTNILPPQLEYNNNITISYPSTPLKSIAAHLDADPRSPSMKRTPVHSPATRRVAYRERVLRRLGNQFNYDPRSPAANRTPISHVITGTSLQTTPPLTLTDPRSPYSTRTPLALPTPCSASEGHFIPEDLCETPENEGLITPKKFDDEKIEQGEVVVVVVEGDGMKRELTTDSIATESTAERMTTETFNSPDSSPPPTIGSPSLSPLGSPSGLKRRMELKLSSPLKKSFSAPLANENFPPSPKLVKTIAKPRAPLSPLTQRSLNVRNSLTVTHLLS